MAKSTNSTNKKKGTLPNSKQVVKLKSKQASSTAHQKNIPTDTKKESDGKTPSGKFELGLAFGMHKKEEIKIPLNIKYIQITSDLYWIDDINSIYYNKLVDIQKVKREWNSAEHLIDYPKQYEYAIEIKSNKENISGNRKCNFSTL